MAGSRYFHRFWFLPRPPLKLLSAFAFSALIVTFVGTVALRASLARGRLSMPPYYDDVVYLYWSQKLLHFSVHQPIGRTLYQILDQHSPLTSLFGLLGYIFFSTGDIGPYIVAATPLIFFVLTCILLFDEGPSLAVIGIVAAIAALPTLRIFVTEFRPEPAWGVLTAISAISYFRVDLFNCSRLKQVGLGLLTGLAVTSKPTTSPLTMVILGAAFCAAGTAEYIEQRKSGATPRLRAMLARTATIWVSAFLIIAPVAAIIGQEIYEYIVWVMRDISTQVKHEGGFLDQVSFYSFGVGGQQILGPTIPIFVAIWIIGGAYVALRLRPMVPRVLALFFVVMLSYLLPSVSVVKLVWFGAAFDALLILATLHLVALLSAHLFQQLDGSPALRLWLRRAAFVLGSVLFFTFNLMEQPSGLLGMDARTREAFSDRTARIWDVLRAREKVRMTDEPAPHTSKVMTIAIEPIVGTVISLYGLKENLPIKGAEFSYARSVDELLAHLPDMDYVVVGPSYHHFLSGAMLGDGLRAAMENQQEFSRVAAIQVGHSNADVYIYERQ
jgi:hypothetical protein